MENLNSIGLQPLSTHELHETSGGIWRTIGKAVTWFVVESVLNYDDVAAAAEEGWNAYEEKY